MARCLSVVSYDHHASGLVVEVRLQTALLIRALRTREQFIQSEAETFYTA
jgi:hypothetical protein